MVLNIQRIDDNSLNPLLHKLFLYHDNIFFDNIEKIHKKFKLSFENGAWSNRGLRKKQE